MSASPSAAVTLARMNAAIDVRGVLDRITAPTLVICRKDDVRVNPGPAATLPIIFPARGWSKFRDAIIRCGAAMSTDCRHRRGVPHRRAAAAGEPASPVCACWSPASSRRRACGRAGRPRMERAHAALGRPRKALPTRRRTGVRPRWRTRRARLDGPAKAVRSAMSLRDAAGAWPGTRRGRSCRRGRLRGRGRRAGRPLAGRLADAAKPGDIVVSLAPPISPPARACISSTCSLVGQGRQPRTPAVVSPNSIWNRPRAGAVTEPCRLSEREREVLKLIAEGLSNPAIAATCAQRTHGEAPCGQYPAETRPADPGCGGGARRARKAAVTGRGWPDWATA